MTSVESVDEFSTRVVNHLKTNGMFDEFRQKCAEDIENHSSFIKVKCEVEELVRTLVVSNRQSAYPLTKNQLRDKIRGALARRKDFLAAADSSIQYSLRKNRDLFAKEINEVSTDFEEEEKKVHEAEKLAREMEAERLAREAKEAERKELEDIPPPPPPPPPRPRTAQKIFSSNDTALLLQQETVFDNDMFASSDTKMTLQDILANVQSDDFVTNSSSASVTANPEEPSEEPPPPSETPVAQTDAPKPSPSKLNELSDHSMSSMDTSSDSLSNMNVSTSSNISNIKEANFNNNSFMVPPPLPPIPLDITPVEPPLPEAPYPTYTPKDVPSPNPHIPSSESHPPLPTSPYPSSSKDDAVINPTIKDKSVTPEHIGTLPKSEAQKVDIKPEIYDHLEYYRHTTIPSVKSEPKSVENKYPFEEKLSYRYIENSKELKYVEYEIPRDIKYELPTKPSKSSYRESREVREKSPWHLSDNLRPEENDTYRHVSSRKSSLSPTRSKSQHIPEYYRSRDIPHPDTVFKSPEYHSSSRAASYHRSSREHRKEEEWRHHYRYGDPNYLSYNHPSTSSSSASYSERDRYRREDKLRHPRDDIMKYPRDDLKYPWDDLKYPRDDLKFPREDLKYPLRDDLKYPREEAKYRHEKEMRDYKYKKDEIVYNFPDYPMAMENHDHTVPPKPPTPSIEYRKNEKFKEPVVPPLPKPEKKRTSNSLSELREFNKLDIPTFEAIKSPPPKYHKEVPPHKQLSGDLIQEISQSLSPIIPEIIPLISPPSPSPVKETPKPKSVEPVKPPESTEAVLSEPVIPQRRSLDHLLPKPKYCSLLKESFSSTSSSQSSIVVIKDFKEIENLKIDPKPTPKFLDTSDLLKLSEKIDPIKQPTNIIKTETKSDLPLKDITDVSTMLPPAPLPTYESQPKEQPKAPESVATPGEESSLKDILRGMKKPTPSSPIILTTTRLKNMSPAVRKPLNRSKQAKIISSDEEEGEILEEGECSETEEKCVREITKETVKVHGAVKAMINESNKEILKDAVKPKCLDMTLKDILARSCELTKPVEPSKTVSSKVETGPKVDEAGSAPSDTIRETKDEPKLETPTLPPGMAPGENFVIKSRKDIFKAHFFSPLLEISEALPEPVKIEETSSSTLTEILTTGPSVRKGEEEGKVVDTAVSDMKYMKKMRFKDILKQHSESQKLTEGNLKKEDTPKTEGMEVKDAPVKPSLTLLGKRKKFLSDYLASLDTTPAKIPKTDEPLSDTLPKLRIKPTCSGSYSAEQSPPRRSTAVPPPLRKVADNTEKGVPKCVIKIDKNWKKKKAEDKKRKTRPQQRRSLRTREASDDSVASKEEELEMSGKKSRSRRNSKKVEEEEEEIDKDSDNSDTERSRKSGRTRKTITRLNL